MKNIIGYWLYKENLSFFFACFFFKLHNNKSEQKEKRHLIKEKSQLGEKHSKERNVIWKNGSIAPNRAL